MAKKTVKIALKLPAEDALKSALVSAAGMLVRPAKSPEESLGELFDDVQNSQVFDDGMTFVDLIPRQNVREINKQYVLQKKDPNFSLEEFVARYFCVSEHEKTDFVSDPQLTPRQHIKRLWPVLERRNRRDRGSLIALPYSYIVPGGRFSSQYYWDSYFTMLGLAADGKWDMVENMVKNCAYMIRKFGFIPTANRTYFLSRSQPPVFALMVKLLAKHNNRRLVYVEYLPYLLAEYRFWMRGRKSLVKMEEASAARRVVRMPDGTMLNRYYDNKKTPRPESHREDLETARNHQMTDKEKLYLDIRAAAESGWDFSSRWFEDVSDLKTIHTTDIVPIDLNCLMYNLEMTIAEAYQALYQPLLARYYVRLAEKRKAAMQKYLWSEKEQFYMDYNYRTGKQTGHVTMAGAFALFNKVASPTQAKGIAGRLQKDFLKKGGLVTTLTETDQQWDSPNGWAPLHWVAIVGLREYGHRTLAGTVRERWLTTVANVYEKRHKMVEKYNVVAPNRVSSGGEYVLQDGFGWTNGVTAALLKEGSLKTVKREEKPRD